MKKNYIICLLLIVGSALQASAQWTSIALCNQVVSDLKTFNGKLFLGGNFTKVNGVTSYASASWNGTSITTQNILIGGGNIRQLEVFNTDLYAAGSLQLGTHDGVGIWDGTTWQDASNFNTSHRSIYADVNDLYVGSDFGEVRKKTGTGSFALLSTALVGGVNNVYAINKYNSSIIIGGKFDSYNTTTLNKIARWDGTTWQPLATGFDAQVNCLAVYNGELYAGGTFTTAGGVPAKFIAKWNGTSWSNVGGSMTGTGSGGVLDMIVYNGALYVVGDFSMMGTTPANYAARWNGTNWASLNFNQGSNFLKCVEVYNNELYVASYSFDSSYVYRTGNFSGIEEAEAGLLQSSIFPNPVAQNLNVSLDAEKIKGTFSFEIYNNTGTLIQKTEFAKSNFSINVESFSTGIYYAVLRRNDGTTSCAKWLKL